MSLSRFALLTALVVTRVIHAAPILYGITFGDQLITVNTSTGAGSLVGSLDTSMFAYDLASRSGGLYTYDQNADLVRQLDPATGHTLSSINLGLGDLAGEGGMAINSSGNGVLYTVVGPNGFSVFYTFTLSPGSGALLSTSVQTFDGLAFDSGGVLYGLEQGGATLDTINTGTGAVSAVGGTGVPAGSGFALGGLTFGSDGTLYAVLSGDAGSSSFYTLNKSTGAATLVGLVGGGFNVSGITFLDTTTATPEPGTASVLMIGLAALVLGVHLRNRRTSLPVKG